MYEREQDRCEKPRQGRTCRLRTSSECTTSYIWLVLDLGFPAAITSRGLRSRDTRFCCDLESTDYHKFITKTFVIDIRDEKGFFQGFRKRNDDSCRFICFNNQPENFATKLGLDN